MRTIRIVLTLVVALLLSQGPFMRLSPSPSLSAQQPVLQVSPASLSFQGQVGGPTPDPQALIIANAGGGLMEWHASADVEWIILGGTEGQLSGGRAIKMWVFVDIEGLSAGTYQGTIKIEAPEAQGSPVQVEVTLTLTQPAYTVCPSGCSYSSIAEAIRDARSGETITIGPGTYEENLKISKSLTLKGAGRERTTIKGKAGGEPVIRIESDSAIEVTLEGLMIAEAKVGEKRAYEYEEDGILIGGKAIMIVRNSKISGNDDDGIEMWDSSQAEISDSEISGNGDEGIVMVSSSQAEISDSQISGNDRDGIWMRGSSQATISGSTISGNGNDGIEMYGSSRAAISGSQISGNGDNGIWMVGSSQAAISDSTISGNDGDGILMWVSRATIRDNEIFENKGYGVALYQRPCFDIPWKFEGKVEGSGNEIHDNGEGAVCPEELEFLMTEEGGQYP